MILRCETLLGFYQEGRNEGTFESGISKALARVLVDPRFIFRMEHVPANLRAGTRLSSERSGTGDPAVILPVEQHSGRQACSNLAIAGKLSNPAVLEQQTRRMLADPKAKSLVDNFASRMDASARTG